MPSGPTDFAETDLIGAIYDAVIDPSRWPDTIDQIRSRLGFHMAVIGVNSLPSGAVTIQASSNVPQYYIDTAGDYGDEVLALWGGASQLSKLPFEEPMVHAHVTDRSLWIGNAFYEEWVRPQGLVDQVALVLENNATMLGTLGLGVHESMPPISNSQIEAVRILAPHLRRAAIISDLLEARIDAAASFEAALNASAAGVVLVDHSMGIVHANPRAQRMLDAADPIVASGGALGIPQQIVKGHLEATVASAAYGKAFGSAGAGIPARRRDGAAVIIHVLPLQPHVSSARPLRAVAAVFIAEANAVLDFPIEAIRLLYGLRPAEARTLELMIGRLPNRCIAEALGIAPSTLKTHTLRLFEKLGVHSRVELIILAREVSLRHR